MTNLNEKDSNLIYDKEYVERLKDKFLKNEKQSDLELLELLLTYSTPKNSNVRVIAQRLLKKYGSLSNLFALPIQYLIEDVGLNTATLLNIVKASALKALWENLE